MALNSIGLGFLFTATDVASGVMQRVKVNFEGLEEAAGRAAQNIDQSLSRIGGGIAAVAIGLGALTASMSLADTAGKFEQQLAATAAVANATQEEYGLLRQAALDAGVATQFDPTR